MAVVAAFAVVGTRAAVSTWAVTGMAVVGKAIAASVHIHWLVLADQLVDTGSKHSAPEEPAAAV